jgi:glycerol-3-phosphate acyltransferase PlsX
MSRTVLARIGYILAKGAFDRLREKMDVRKTNGGVFLGLNGLVVKSHGGTDAEGFAAAVELAYDMARRDLLGRIRSDFELFRGSRPGIAAGAPMNEATGTVRHAG